MWKRSRKRARVRASQPMISVEVCALILLYFFFRRPLRFITISFLCVWYDVKCEYILDPECAMRLMCICMFMNALIWINADQNECDICTWHCGYGVIIKRTNVSGIRIYVPHTLTHILLFSYDGFTFRTSIFCLSRSLFLWFHFDNIPFGGVV